MPAKTANSAELIRKIMDGRAVSSARRELVAMGSGCVDPVLDALTGGHGSFHPHLVGESVNHLIKVLEDIAERDAKCLAASLTHDAPSANIAVWALGHSSSPLARRILQDFADHEDSAIGDVARYHLERQARQRGRGAAPRRSASKASKKKTTKKKKAAAKKKPSARKRATSKASARKKVARKATRKKR